MCARMVCLYSLWLELNLYFRGGNVTWLTFNINMLHLDFKYNCLFLKAFFFFFVYALVKLTQVFTWVKWGWIFIYVLSLRYSFWNRTLFYFKTERTFIAIVMYYKIEIKLAREVRPSVGYLIILHSNVSCQRLVRKDNVLGST